MVVLATASNPAFVAFDGELRRTGPSYTVETLAELAKDRPGDELYLIVGRDTLPELATWREPQRLFSLCRVAVAGRPGTQSAAPPPGAQVVEVPGPELKLSATQVRQRVREGKSIRYLVADAVADYITKRKLYA
jgi:nicotinate-nucleotide adenylyltransferase